MDAPTPSVPEAVDPASGASDRPPGRPASRLYQVVRRVLWDGIDTLSLTPEEAQTFLDRLVARGELASDEAQRLLQELPLAERQELSAEALLERRIQALLERWNVPTRDEIDALSRQITALTDRVERLRRLHQDRGTA